MKLYLGVVRPSMLYRWTCGPHVRHDETLPGCCAHIHAVQVDMGPARGHVARTSDMMKLYLGVVHTSMLYRWTWGLHVRHDETLPGCCAHIHAVQVDMWPARGHVARTSDMMKLYLGVVHTSMLYRWTWGLHVRHDETLPGCCAHIHAVQVDMEPARQT
ncbi:hypothetical protein RRG08_025837 [Elysia crispata]|uniref:Uncharacterized protein n=1 Tax=Elysia crispata TaxID=231223 RepID=A0AAE1CRP5_9GAST|nr:hypothetical protein RRG08_025837 [Elysia crispata]